VMCYTLDGFGGVHPFGGAREIFGSAQWTADIARGLVLTTARNGLFVQGYTLDYSGGIHPFGGAPAISASAVWPGHDMADSIVAWTGAKQDAPGGWVHGHGAIYNSALNIPGQTTVVNHNPSAAWIAEQVSAGHPVIVGMNLPSGGTHFVVLTGQAGSSDYWVNDPWEQNAMHVPFS